jgi:hypothetical protein
MKANPINVNKKPMIKEVLPNRSNMRILKGTNIGDPKKAGYEDIKIFLIIEKMGNQSSLYRIVPPSP